MAFVGIGHVSLSRHLFCFNVYFSDIMVKITEEWCTVAVKMLTFVSLAAALS